MTEMVAFARQIPGAGSSSISFDQELFPITNPVPSTYVLSNTPVAGSEVVSLNGQIVFKGVSEYYTISGDTITINAGCLPIDGDVISVHYAY